MKRILFWFAIRLGILLVLSIVMGIMAVLPLPSLLRPFAALFFYPVAWFWKAIGLNELLFIPPHASLLQAVYIVARLAIPFYLLVSYGPELVGWLLRWARTLTRKCLEVPTAFTVYFVAGGLVGCLLGLYTWASTGCAGSSWGLISIAFGTTGLTGWSAAVLRCSIALRHGWARR